MRNYTVVWDGTPTTRRQLSVPEESAERLARQREVRRLAKIAYYEMRRRSMCPRRRARAEAALTRLLRKSAT